jgi:hypothetical protein
MLRWVFINPLTSLFQLWSTIFSSWLSTHQLSLVFQPPIFYILATTTLCEELGIYKPTLILYSSFLLSFTLSGAPMLGIHKPTHLLYLSMLGHIQALSNIWSWIFSLSLQLQLILFEVGTPISSLLQDVSSNTSSDG